MNRGELFCCFSITFNWNLFSLSDPLFSARRITSVNWEGVLKISHRLMFFWYFKGSPTPRLAPKPFDFPYVLPPPLDLNQMFSYLSWMLTALSQSLPCSPNVIIFQKAKIICLPIHAITGLFTNNRLHGTIIFHY